MSFDDVKFFGFKNKFKIENDETKKELIVEGDIRKIVWKEKLVEVC